MKMSIEELKVKIENKAITTGLYSASDKIIQVFANGFTIMTFQENGWTRENIYEYDGQLWTESEMYNK